MKVVTIGDIHGSTTWENVDPNTYDKIIFVGDYVDSWNMTNQEELENLKNIIDLKKELPQKVELLIGNHDFQYMFDNPREYRCSGYRPLGAIEYGEVFRDNKNLFKFAYAYDDNLWTHAGLTKGYMRSRDIKGTAREVAHQLNELRPRDLWVVGRSRGGWYEHGSIIWADHKEVVRSPAPYNQVYGHTQHEAPITKQVIVDNKIITLVNVDCIPEQKDKFYVLDL